MNEQITELKVLHIKSKPELETFLNNIEASIAQMAVPKMIKLLSATEDIVRGYDAVIDVLFMEIDRLQSLSK